MFYDKVKKGKGCFSHLLKGSGFYAHEEFMKNQDLVRRINPNLVMENGRLKPFSEQLLEYEYGIYPNSRPFVVSNVTMRLSDALVLPLPIVITQSTIRHIKEKHNIDKSFILGLERMIRNNVLMLQSRKSKNSLVIVTDCVDKEDKPIVIVLNKGFKVGDVPTNQIRSMYEKRNIEEFLVASFEDGCAFYPNEKTEQWLTSQRLQLPPDVTSALFYDYNIPEALYCQAENVCFRNNYKEKWDLDLQIRSAKIKRKKKNHFNSRQKGNINKKGVFYEEIM